MADLLEIDYTNYKGKRGTYVIEPLKLEMAESDWHLGRQWILTARDVKRDVIREFCWKDIHASWRVQLDGYGNYTAIGPVLRLHDDEGL